MNEKNKIAEDIKSWLLDNKARLPLNIDHWKLHVLENTPDENASTVSLGKYNAELVQGIPFYKPYSKITII